MKRFRFGRLVVKTFMSRSSNSTQNLWQCDDMRCFSIKREVFLTITCPVCMSILLWLISQISLHFENLKDVERVNTTARVMLLAMGVPVFPKASKGS